MCIKCIRDTCSWVTPRAIITICLYLIATIRPSAAPGEIDTTFQAKPLPDDSPFSLAVQTDGKLIIGSNKPRVFRPKTDGSVDDSFNASVLPLVSVYKVRLTADGSILVNGLSAIDSVTPIIIRLLHDGTLDQSFKPDFVALSERVQAFAATTNGSVVYYANVVQNGRFIASYVQ